MNSIRTLARNHFSLSTSQPFAMLKYSSLRSAGFSLLKSSTSLRLNALRAYSSSPSVPRSEIEERVLNVLRGFDKVDQSKVTLNSHFIKDLGLDSLDAVEVIMAIEDEFSVEIPERDVDQILTPAQAVEFLEKNPSTH